MRTIAHTSMTRIAVQAVVASLMIICFAVSAPAVPLTWTFNNVTFDDRGTLTGSFVFNADTTTYSSFNIVTAGGDPTFFPPFTYSPATSTITTGPFGGSDETLLTIESKDLLRELNLEFLSPGGLGSPLTNAGGTISLRTQDEGVGGNLERGSLQTDPTEFDIRGFKSGGTIQAPGSPSSGAPEPPSAASMMLGLSVFAITLYLKRSRHSAGRAHS